MTDKFVMVPVNVLADIEAHKSATVSQFMGANHMALVLAQKINEWADLLAAAPKPSAEPVGFGLLGRKSRAWDGETFVSKADAGGYDSDALLPLYAGQPPAVEAQEQPAPIPTSERLPILYRIRKRDTNWRSEAVITVNSRGCASTRRLLATGWNNDANPHNIRWSKSFNSELDPVAWVPTQRLPRPITSEMIWNPKTTDFGPVNMDEIEWLIAQGECVEIYDPNTGLTRPQNPEADA